MKTTPKKFTDEELDEIENKYMASFIDFALADNVEGVRAAFEGLILIDANRASNKGDFDQMLTILNALDESREMSDAELLDYARSFAESFMGKWNDIVNNRIS